jgi:hypothetical protein
MVPFELLARLADTLNALQVPYLITGSMASGAYGEPRMTNDIDVVVELDLPHVEALLAAFPAPDYYCSREAMREAVRAKFQFNILHLTSGMKVDVILATASDFDRSRFQRARRIQTAGTVVAFASPEDVILKKLLYFQAGGSEKHLRDIVGILKVQAGQIDQLYLTEWIVRLGVAEEWQLVQTRMPSVKGA